MNTKKAIWTETDKNGQTAKRFTFALSLYELWVFLAVERETECELAISDLTVDGKPYASLYDLWDESRQD